MSRRALRVVVAFGSGALFGAGLIVSGMTEPAKVLAFLDVLGAWDPSLAFVMVGAIAVHASTLRLFAGRAAPLANSSLSASPPPRIDPKLVLGALVFGVGWGLSGYCPGPSIVALPAGSGSTAIFVASLVLGNLAVSAWEGLSFERRSGTSALHG